VEIPASFAVTALLIFAAVRFGILAFTVALFVYGLLASAPLTLDLSRWYAARGFLFVALILALAAWAFRVSLGSRPVFGGARLDDA
jgi:drug/metabolite transporter superfamily protein YnfA